MRPRYEPVRSRANHTGREHRPPSNFALDRFGASGLTVIAIPVLGCAADRASQQPCDLSAASVCLTALPLDGYACRMVLSQQHLAYAGHAEPSGGSQFTASKRS